MGSSFGDPFKWRHFHGLVILQCVRWYCKYGISYRDLEEMMGERGLMIDHTTLYRWVQTYAPELKKRSEWYQRKYCSAWHLDETYIKVKGKWKYLYRAIDEQGNTLDFYLSHKRNKKAAKRFLSKLLKRFKTADLARIHTDKNPCYASVLKGLRAEGKIPEHTQHRQIKYENNTIEADHGQLKRLIRPMRGLQSMKTAHATIQGVEVMRMFKKGQFDSWLHPKRNSINFINQLFGFPV